MSRLASSCPHCGATSKRQHGVFYYVFWGVISLFATLLILGFATVVLTIGIPAFFAGREAAQRRSASNQASTNGVTVDPSVTLQNQKRDYARSHVQLYEFNARYFDSVLDGKVPGVDFKLRNTGTRTLKKVEVTVYFKDQSGKIIAEKEFDPVLVSKYRVSDDNSPLKPNYIWQMEKGKFYPAKSVPSEWQEGNAEAKITDIDFDEPDSKE